MMVSFAIVSELAQRFFRWLHESPDISVSEKSELNKGMTRDRVGELFQIFCKRQSNPPSKKGNLEGRVMASLRIQKLMRSRRYDKAVVVCVFCNEDGKTFAPIEERKTAREKLQKERQELRNNREGIVVSEEPKLELCGNNNAQNNDESIGAVVPMNRDIAVSFEVLCDASKPIVLKKIRLSGSHKGHFSIPTDSTPLFLPDVLDTTVIAKFKTNRIAAHRVTFCFQFVTANDNTNNTFTILRDIVLKSGDPKLYGVLEAKQPYVKKKKFDTKQIAPKDIFHPPKKERRFGGYKGLQQFRIPKHTMRRVETGELEDSLVVPWDNKDKYDDDDDDGFGVTYSNFWQNLLWASELQAYEDIRLFDLENVALFPRGKHFKLYVSGLAEGRPSVLKGDLVLCQWKNKEYRGRVIIVEQLDVILEFHSIFNKNFKATIDRLERVRFTFGRTNFRTSHAGMLQAPQSMETAMLLPTKADVEASIQTTTSRRCPSRFKWTSSLLNEEQKQAVKAIVMGKVRPLPYVIFGPPGTGKTTTLVEAIYQLANLQNHNLKILVVAPSNDATDILVEKLSQYFPPSEMVRVLAFTRSIDQVPEMVRKYCTDGMEGQQVIEKVLGVQITVTTINMASRLWCTGDGLPKGHFDVLCVDEAGHATEPEVIAVASTVMDFNQTKKKKEMGGQLILAGDPMQLGPIVTSELCKTFKMDRSYLERLVQTSPAYSLEHNSNLYPPHLVTFLVNNYRSHPDILKLPNELFYRNQLIAQGDVFQTHSMAKWEHLPTKGFPILFHAVDGENTREGSSPSWFNPQEAMVVVEYVQKLVNDSKPKVSPEDIGIITPYARQVQKIRLALEVSNINNVKVGSVETFQGQERRVIIVSTVRSENSLLQHDLRYNLGFVANEKRFNVAVTRAKSLLIVVGNPRVLETDTKNWLPLLRFCKSKNSWLGEDWIEGADSSSSEESDDDDGDELDDDEWAAAAQEGYCFVNREE